MNRRRIIQKTIQYMLFFLIFLSLGIYSGFRNSEDDIFQILEFPQIIEEVNVYRDEKGIPTIIANNLADLLFVQGYEYARDRIWQLELYRALVNGELSKLFGSDMVKTDILVRTLGLKRIGLEIEKNLDQKYLNMVNSYVSGINLFYENHRFNKPWEFEVLGIDATDWTIADSLAMQGVIALNFAFSGLETELMNLEIIKKVGMEKFLDLFPPEFEEAASFLMNITENFAIIPDGLMEEQNDVLNLFDNGAFASNAWVVNDTLTENGYSILANDPHINLEVPSLWYQVNLHLANGDLKVEGFALPGIPFVIIGHNDNIAWGITSSMVDNFDLFYFQTNGSQYIHNNESKDFNIVESVVEVNGDRPFNHRLLITNFGPVINVTNGWFAIKWSYTENYRDNQMIRAFYLLITAETIPEATDALSYLGAPSLNFILADLDGNIALKLVGMVPIREEGFGTIPLNASNLVSGWQGKISYDDLLYIENPDEGYLISANQKIVDETDIYYGGDTRFSYRADRIEEILVNQTRSNIKVENGLTLKSFQKIQADVVNLAAVDLFKYTLGNITSEYNQTQTNDDLLNIVLDDIKTWNFEMTSNSIAASLFATFRLELLKSIYQDELGEDLIDKIDYVGFKPMIQMLSTNTSDIWFDNINTNSTSESKYDIVIEAFDNSISYLQDNYGSDTNMWRWGNIHKVYFKHSMGDSAPFLNGLNIGPLESNGSTFTINSYLNTPSLINGEINFESSFGPSVRIIIELSENWDNVYGILAPGNSGHLTSDNFDDSVSDWINFNYYQWTFNPLIATLQQPLTVRYVHGSN